MPWYEVWRDTASLTLLPAADVRPAQESGLLPHDASFVRRFCASDWEAALAEHHRRQEWEPYRPMQDA